MSSMWCEEVDRSCLYKVTEESDKFVPHLNNAAFRSSSRPTMFSTNINKINQFPDLVIGNGLLEFIATETDRYHTQNCNKYKLHENSVRQLDIIVTELKTWFSLVCVKHPRINDCWSTNPLIETPIFSRAMSHNIFRQILKLVHFSNNTNVPHDANQFFKVQHIRDYSSKKI